MNRFIFSLIFFSLLVLISGSVNALTNVSACGTLSTAGETYQLTQDITSAGTCFTIGANNITLDCVGHSVTGNGTGYGVLLQPEQAQK